jgi:hypothetical protein
MCQQKADRQEPTYSQGIITPAGAQHYSSCQDHSIRAPHKQQPGKQPAEPGAWFPHNFWSSILFVYVSAPCHCSSAT